MDEHCYHKKNKTILLDIMCGTPISGPILILFYPLALGLRAGELVVRAFEAMDTRIRKNNEKIDHNLVHLYKDWTEKIVLRKQLWSEKKLAGKIKTNVLSTSSNNNLENAESNTAA